jgi:hypothetical protein
LLRARDEHHVLRNLRARDSGRNKRRERHEGIPCAHLSHIIHGNRGEPKNGTLNLKISS